MARYKILAKPKGKTLAQFKKKGWSTRAELVTRSSGEGGGTRYFSSLAQARSYARQLNRNYTTKIIEVPTRKKKVKKTQPSYVWGPSSMKSNGGWGL